MRAWPRRLTPAGAPTWLVLLICGALWGWTITGIETLREPPAGLPLRLVIEFMLNLAISWSLTGVCWAVGTRLAALRPSKVRMVLFWILGTAVFSASHAAMNVTPDLFEIGVGVSGVVGARIPFEAIFIHILWLNGVFGGLYVAGYAAFQGMVRSRRRLARLQLALIDEAALLEEARLTTLRGVLQPRVLLETVQVLRARYETDPAAADDLLDRLVAYLRAATGHVGRSPRVLAAEPTVDETYATLQAALAAGPTAPATASISGRTNVRSLP